MMALKLKPPREGRSPYWYVRGTFHGHYIDRSTQTESRDTALAVMTRWEKELASVEYPNSQDGNWIKLRNESDLYENVRRAATEGRGLRLSPFEVKLLSIQPFIKSTPWLPHLEWRKVPGYEQYEVSSEGHVRREGRAVNPTEATSGHLKITLYNGQMHGNVARGWSTHIHRIVAIAFIGPSPFPGAVVRHLNGHPADNRLENLRWGTTEENMADMQEHRKNGKPEFIGTNPSRSRGRKNSRTLSDIRIRQKEKMLQRLARI